jgi:hypothetical protein
VFVFGKLKQDLETFRRLIEKNRPEIVLGMAEVESSSRFETFAVNQFNLNKINRQGRESYSLFVPPEISFPVTTNTTNTFCNWTMYKISEIIQGMNCKIAFVHFNGKDVDRVIDQIKKL